jgi:uncharacterized protein (TIGR02452 family)
MSSPSLPNHASRAKECDDNANIIFPQLFKHPKFQKNIAESIFNTECLDEGDIPKHKSCSSSSSSYDSITNELEQKLNISSTSTTGPCRIQVVNENAIDFIEQLHKEFPNEKILVQNPCSNTKPGGGYLNGAAALEEEYCRKFMLYPTLETNYRKMFCTNKSDKSHVKFFYPFVPQDSPKNHPGLRRIIYSPNVYMIRNSKGAPLPLESIFPVSFASMAAVRNPQLDETNQYMYCRRDFTLMENKIRDFFRLAIWKQYKILVLCGFGCGCFRCPAQHVAEIFDSVLKESEFQNAPFKQIYLPIIDFYLNTNNYQIFKSVLNPQKNELPESKNDDNIIDGPKPQLSQGQKRRLRKNKLKELEQY